jgi:uncharacterized repeat protein (TIGR02543 family)
MFFYGGWRMKRVRVWAAVAAVMVLCAGCKDFFHPEGPTMPGLGRYPVTDEEAAEIFRENEAVKEVLEIKAEAIDLDAPEGELADFEAKVDEALAAYAKLPEGARGALAAEKAKLDAVKQKIGHVNSAQGFLKGSYAEVLDKQADDVTTIEEVMELLPVLEKALDEYEALDEPVKVVLKSKGKDHGAPLGSLKAKVDEIIAASEPVIVTVSFDSHGGTAVEAIQGNLGTAVNAPDEPTRNGGYIFTGWFDAENGVVKFSWPYVLVKDVTMHAQWRDDAKPPPVQYTVSFESNGGRRLLR